jgi:hypothetical protein
MIQKTTAYAMTIAAHLIMRVHPTSRARGLPHLLIAEGAAGA